MPLPKKLLAFLERAKTPYEPFSHRVVYTAYDTAQTLRVKVTEVAKPLLVKADKRFALALLSAGHTLDLTKVTKLLNAKKVRIPTEKEILALLKLKKKEGLSSFGSLYALPTLLEKSFAKNVKGIFSTGSFTDSVKIKLKDFIKLESPTVGIFGLVKKVVVPKKKKSPKKQRSKK
ncbi:MAG: YbaK/EbsC family protein [Patescibacteria group bacterium]